MDVASVKPELKPAIVSKGSGSAAAEGTVKPQQVAQDQNRVKNDERKLSREDFSLLASELNKFMDSLDVNIKFAIHDKTQQVMVRVMDAKEEKVLREYPASELLDTLAAIRDYVGVLLDKKA